MTELCVDKRTECGWHSFMGPYHAGVAGRRTGPYIYNIFNILINMHYL